MNWKDWFAPGRSAAMVAVLAACVYLIGRGIADEAPVGSVGGTAVMLETGKPIKDALIVLTPIDAESGGGVTRHTVTDDDGTFSIEHLRAGDYTVEASAKAHRLKPTRITVPEGKRFAAELQLKPIDPYLDLLASQKVFTPDEKPSFELHGFAPRAGLEVSVFRLDFAKVLAAGGLRDALGPLAERWRSNPADPGKMGALTSSFTRGIENRDAEGVFQEAVQLGALAEGVYWVRCRVGSTSRGTYLNVTRAALVTKSVGKQVTCFVTDIVSGKPLSGATVGYGSATGFVAQASTDTSGRATMSVPAASRAAVMAEWGKSKALVDFYIDSQENADARIATYTDRPIYRPGDTISYKGIVRRLVGDSYRLPAQGGVTVEIRDMDDSLFDTATLPLSGFGTYHGSFSLSKESPPGYYQIITRYGGAKETRVVTIAAYRKPEFSVTVTPNKPFYVRGDKAQATVKCEYYYGAPAVGAEVSVYVDRQPYFSFGNDESDEDAGPADPEEGPSYRGGEGYDVIKAVTDDKGEAAIEFDTVLPSDPKEAETDFMYNLNASVKDVGGKFFEGSGSVKVVRGDVDLSIRMDDSIVEQGKPVRATVIAKKPGDGSPIAGLKVDVTDEFEVWTGRKSVPMGSQSSSVVTGSDGTATLTVTPTRSGELRFTAEAHDVLAREWAFVEGGPVEDLGPKPPKLALRLDKHRYSVGDQATVMITTDSPGGSALVALEGDKLYSSRVVELRDKVTIVKMPVTQELAPNAFVAAAYVHSKRYSEATKRLVVDLGTKRLDVSVQSDKTVYRPGDVVHYTVHTAAAGKPVPAEVSLSVVDESIFAIREDDVRIVESFYPKRVDRVQTEYSFPELYLDGGDKGSINVKVRTDFKDTAYWNPTVVTGQDGTAAVDVKLPDNLTQWRATAVAVSRDTQVGSAALKVRARKDLMVRLEGPAFIVQEDSQRVVAVVSNDTGRDADVHFQLAADGVTVYGEARQTLHIRNGDRETLDWRVAAPSSGAAVVEAKVWTDSGDSDGVRLTMPIEPHGREVVQRQAGDVAGSAAFTMTLFDGADPNSGQLHIQITPTIASAIVRSLDSLIDYPYGCVEQTMDRFMPTVVVAQALSKLKLPPPSRAKEIPSIVRDGFARLAKMQHSDGGWGWWDYDDSDPHMTAYVLEGTALAGDAGFHPGWFSVDRALTWAESRLRQPTKLDRKAAMYLAYAVALHGATRTASDALAALKYDPDKGGAIESATALMTYARLGQAFASQRDRCLRRLLSLARGSGGTRYWREEYWGVETTARCLQAVASVDPKNPILGEAARYLMLQRRGTIWDSTRDTSYAILGLLRVMGAVQAPAPGTVVRVSVNGADAGEFTLTQAALTNPGLTIDVPVRNLKTGDNRIELVELPARGAKGRPTGALYYSADLRQVVVRGQLPEIVNGEDLKIRRDYYKMEVRRQDDGTLKLIPSSKPATTAQPGDILKCVVTIQSAHGLDFVMVRDPIPAGFHVTERGSIGEDEEWDEWYCGITIRDDSVTFFARHMDKGVNTISYMMRAETPGISHALPASVSNMYDPDVQASSPESVLEVRE